MSDEVVETTAPVETAPAETPSTESKSETLETGAEYIDAAGKPEVEEKPKEDTEKPKEDTEKPKPWRKSKPSVIPYERFSEVVAERTAERTAREKLEQELSEYKKRLEAPAPEVSDVPDPAKLNPADYNSPQEFFAAQADAMKKQVDYQVKQQLEATRKNAIETEEIRSVANTYTERLQAAAKADPELIEVDEYLGTLADPSRTAHPIPGNVTRALIRDELAPWVAKAIASDERCLQQLQYGDPMESMIMIGQISGYIRAHQAPSSGGTTQKEGTPSNLLNGDGDRSTQEKAHIEELRETIPTHIKSSSTAPTIRNMNDAAKYLSAKDYTAWCRKHHK